MISRICVIGITLGVAAFVVVLSVMNGFNDSIRNRYLAIEPHFVFYGLTESDNNTITTDVTEAAEDHGVKVVGSQFFHEQDVFIKGPDGFSGGIAKGVSRPQLIALFQAVEDSKNAEDAPKRNQHPSFTVTTNETLPSQVEIVKQLKTGEIMMGMELARTMGIFEGDEIDIMPPETLLLPAGEIPTKERVTVKSLFVVDVAEIDSRYIYYVKDESLTGLGTPASLRTGYEFRVDQPELYSGISDQLEKKYKGHDTWVDRNSALFLALKLEKITMTTFMSLSGLITCFTIITILILLITQKRADVGIMMTLGLSPAKTQSLFQWIGGFLFGAGLFGGLFLGVAISLFLQYYPLEILPEIYYDRTLPCKLDTAMTMYMVVAATFIALITTWIPAKRMAQLNPVTALRKK